MPTKLRPEKPVAGVTNCSLKPWLTFSASACEPRIPPVPMSVGFGALVENAPGCPPDWTACLNAATPESTSTAFFPFPTGTGVPVLRHVYAYVAGSFGVSTFPTWKISEPTGTGVPVGNGKYALIRCAASVLVAMLPVRYVQKPPATTPGLGAATCASANVAAIASGMRRRASRQGDRPIDFIKCRGVIFCFSC
jgi:hypothetical protein